jgi:hypothetical protein
MFHKLVQTSSRVRLFYYSSCLNTSQDESTISHITKSALREIIAQTIRNRGKIMAVAVDSLITPEILKPARYLGNELGAVHKPLESATVRWALTYPEIYEVGASNLGHIILYSIINAQPRQLCVGEAYADFFDFIALGDGEELLPEIGLVVEDGKNAGLNRRDLLLDLAQVPGVYVPQFYDSHPDGSVKPNHPEVPERILRRVATPIPAYSLA